MAVARKKETVSVSFHYLCREQKNGESPATRVPFTQAEFNQMVSALKAKPASDLKDEKVKDRLRFKTEVPTGKIVSVDARTAFGVFKSSYWGHAYENTDKGTIPASSVSLRPFHFMLYLSVSGRIYIASQYLGQFGGYTGLERTISDLLPDSGSVIAYSFVSGSAYNQNVQPKEVQVTIARQSDKITSGNAFSQGAVIAFKKQSKDDGFEKEVSRSLLRFLGKPHSQIKQAVADLINDNELIEVKDEDIQDCTVIATIDGKRKKIYLMESGSFASKFPINVPLTNDGHPEYEATKNEIYRVLSEQIISRSEQI